MRFTLLVAALIGGLLLPATSFADKDNQEKHESSEHGKPFVYLQQQINQLQTELNTIQLTPGPQGPQGVPGPQGPAGPAAGEAPPSPIMGYVMFDGIPDPVPFRAFNVSVSKSSTGLSFSNLDLTLAPTSAMVNLLQANVTGQLIAKADVYLAGGNLLFELQQVGVASQGVHVSPGPDATVLLDVSLAYTRIQMAWNGQVAGWDVAANQTLGGCDVNNRAFGIGIDSSGVVPTGVISVKDFSFSSATSSAKGSKVSVSDLGLTTGLLDESACYLEKTASGAALADASLGIYDNTGQPTISDGFTTVTVNGFTLKSDKNGAVSQVIDLGFAQLNVSGTTVTSGKTGNPQRVTYDLKQDKAA